jgi:hypothetical protein
MHAQLEQDVEKVCLSSWSKMLRKSTKYLNMCSSFILKLQPCALLHFVSYDISHFLNILLQDGQANFLNTLFQAGQAHFLNILLQDGQANFLNILFQAGQAHFLSILLQAGQANFLTILLILRSLPA